jgi:hypothetical protein
MEILSNGICTVTMSGVTVHIRFGIPASREFFNELETDPDLIQNDEWLTEVGIATLLNCGYRNACLVRNEIPDITKGDFLLYVEEALVDDKVRQELNVAVATYTASKYTRKIAENLNVELDELKKKVLNHKNL